MTRNGAVAGMTCGGITSAVWPLLKIHINSSIFQLYEIVPGFILALIAIYIVSKIDEGRGIVCTPNYSKDEEIEKSN